MGWRLQLEDMLPEATEVRVPAVDFEQQLFDQGVVMQSRMLQLGMGALAVGTGILPEQKKSVKRLSRDVPAFRFVDLADRARAATRNGNTVRAFESVFSTFGPLNAAMPVMEKVFMGTAQLCSGIPVVQVAVVLGRGIAALRRMVRRMRKYGAKGERLYPPQEYDREIDRLVAEDQVRRLLAGNDLTRMFSPPAMGSPCAWQLDVLGGAYAITSIEGGGTEITRWRSQCVDGSAGPDLPWGSMGYLGGIPGGKLHQSIYFDQSVEKDLGPTLLPACAVLTSAIWAKIAGSGAAMSLYQVAPDVASADWEKYLSSLRVFLFESPEISASRRKSLLKKYAADDLFGWSTANDINAMDVESLRPVRALAKLQERQLQGMDTLLCAYVSANDPGVRFSPPVRDRMEENRAKLLTHPARCRVDLDSVSDLEFRDALIESRQGAQTCAPGSLTFAPTDDDIEQTGVDGQDNGLDDTGSSSSSAQEKSPLPAVALLGLGAAGLFALSKRR